MKIKIKRSLMRRYLKLASSCGVFLLAVSLSAFGNSNGTFSDVSLVGAPGTASGGFMFNSTTDSFSDLSVSFTGSEFGGLGSSDISGGQGTSLGGGLYGFSWQTQLSNGDLVWDSVVFDVNNGQYLDFGGIETQNRQNQGDFNYLSVPEGGTPLSYLMLSGVAMFAGIFISRKRRRIAQSS
jgi:hypothetical protein